MATSANGIVIRQVPYDPEDWDAIVDGYPDAEVYHSSAWIEYLRDSQGAVPIVAEVMADGMVVGHFVGATVKRFGMRILGAPLAGWGTQVMGFLLHDGVDRREAVEALVPFAYGELGCLHVQFGDRKLGVEELEGTGYEIKGAEMSFVDLSGSEDDVIAQARSRTRTYMRRGAKSGLRAEITSGVEFADEYYAQLVDVFASSDLVPTYGLERVRALIERLEPSGQILLVRLTNAGGDRIGTSISLRRGERGTLWGLAFYREYARLHPVEPLYWETMRALRERGCIIYNLAGSEATKAKFSSAVERAVGLHHSRYPILEYGRNAVRKAFYMRQRVKGRLAQRAQVRGSGAQVPPAD